MDHNIYKAIYEILEKFKVIKAKGYIKDIYKDAGASGKIFEDLLQIRRNFNAAPDYKGVEIKTKCNYSKYDLTLFSLLPSYDGYINEKYIDHIVNNYGYIKDGVSTEKILFTYCFATFLNKGNGDYYFWLNVDRNAQKIWINIFDEKLRIRSKSFYWDFDTLTRCLDKKLKYLAYINVNADKRSDSVYFKYENINFYRIKGFNNFIKLIENGTIYVCFNIGRLLMSI